MEVVKSVSMNRSSVLLQSQLVLQDIQVKQASLETKLNASKALDAQKIADLGLYESQNEDEGEIMLLAMILLQLHGVKFPLNQSVNDDGLGKKKRQRTSPDQLAILEQIFQTDKMPDQRTRVHLADKLGMSSRRVQIWFQNKRAKVKRGGSGKDGDNDSSFSRRDSMSLSSDEAESPEMDLSSSYGSSSSLDMSQTLTLSSLVSSASSSSSSSSPLSLSAATPFDFSPSAKQFSLSSFEPTSNLLPDFAKSPRMSVAQSI